MSLKRVMIVIGAAGTITSCASTAARLPAAASDLGSDFAFEVVEATTRDWSEVFEAEGRHYEPPSLVTMSTPEVRDRNASQYWGAGLRAVWVELADLRDLDAAAGAEAPSWSALFIAHEVAHHVQDLLGRTAQAGGRAGQAIELEADCYAGFWLARANARAIRTTSRPRFPTPTPEQYVRKGLLGLEAVHASTPSDPLSHGAPEQRAAAVRRGLAANSRKDCEI